MLKCFHSSPLRRTLPQRNYAEIISVWNESNFHRKSRTRDFIQHSSLWEQWTTHKSCITWKGKIGINWNFGNRPFWFISSDSCQKKMLLESVNIPLSDQGWFLRTQDLGGFLRILLLLLAVFWPLFFLIVNRICFFWNTQKKLNWPCRFLAN